MRLMQADWSVLLVLGILLRSLCQTWVKYERGLAGKMWHDIIWLAKDRAGWRRLLDTLCSS